MKRGNKIMISMNKEIKKSIKSTKGFSLIEILVALTLLALFGTFAIQKFFDIQVEGQTKATRILMNSISSTLSEFRRHCYRYPTTEEGLKALISKPTEGKDCKNYPIDGYLEKAEIPIDPWGNDIDYESKGKKFILKSYGPDQEPDTEDDIQYPEKK